MESAAEGGVVDYKISFMNKSENFEKTVASVQEELYRTFEDELTAMSVLFGMPGPRTFAVDRRAKRLAGVSDILYMDLPK